MKFTFKTTNPTGPYSSFSNPIHDIKLQKKVVGSISPEEPYQISFRVIKKDLLEDGNANCPWKWIRLKKEFISLLEAKEFLNARINDILERYNLYQTRVKLKFF